jgi:hypothetical protein
MKNICWFYFFLSLGIWWYRAVLHCSTLGVTRFDVILWQLLMHRSREAWLTAMQWVQCCHQMSITQFYFSGADVSGGGDKIKSRITLNHPHTTQDRSRATKGELETHLICTINIKLVMSIDICTVHILILYKQSVLMFQELTVTLWLHNISDKVSTWRLKGFLGQAIVTDWFLVSSRTKCASQLIPWTYLNSCNFSFHEGVQRIIKSSSMHYKLIKLSIRPI